MKTLAALALLILAPFMGVRMTPPQRSGAEHLQALADAERTFAKAARVKGWRAAFLEFFAEDAIALTPDPSSAIARLKTRPVKPFSEEELTWEPKAGDIAASGEMGWLTGPSTFIDHTAKDSTPGYGNYLSVWKKQPNGQWRVYIDVGTNVDAPVKFPTWFKHVTAVPRYKPTRDTKDAKETEERTTAGLLEADRQLNAALATSDAGKLYVARTVEQSRLHRAGTTPAISVGPAEIAHWFSANPAPMTATTTTGETAKSADVGYTYGKYAIAVATPQHGAYVRMWSRGGDGQWRVAADVTSPIRN
jgi:ketosteroid isomerase-like protein